MDLNATCTKLIAIDSVFVEQILKAQILQPDSGISDLLLCMCFMGWTSQQWRSHAGARWGTCPSN